MADIAASVLAKLRNKAKDSGISYQQCLQLFMQEEFLRKLSKSGYDDFLVLKGGLFIYTLTNFESRATIDVDFLLRGYSNSINNVKDLICKIIDTPTGNDYIDMTAKGFEEISPQRKYHGISTQIIGRIKNVRVPFNVDIGVGDVIVPKAEQRKINTQLPDFEAPVIKTYSLESTIAEKFDAILQRFELTGRMKDFYDIYYLSRTFDFEGAKLQSAVFETLQRRGTPYDRNSFKRVVALAEDEDMQKRWKYFLKNIKDNTLEFSVVITEIQTFLEPVFKAIVNEEEWLDCTDDIFSGINPAIIGGKKENHYKYIAKNDRGTFYINTFKLNSRTQIRFRKARENHENSLHTINTLIDEILLKFQYNAELHDLKDLIYQLDNLRHLKQQELGKLPKDEMFEKAEEYLNDKGIENSLVFEEYNMDFKMKFNGSTYYCELLVDNSLEEKTEYRKNISVEKLTTWFEKLNSNFGILFYYPRINRMYFYPVSNNMTLPEITDGKKIRQIKINDKCLL